VKLAGGCWRYPSSPNHCFHSNPHFPDRRVPPSLASVRSSSVGLYSYKMEEMRVKQDPFDYFSLLWPTQTWRDRLASSRHALPTTDLCQGCVRCFHCCHHETGPPLYSSHDSHQVYEKKSIQNISKLHQQ